MSELPKGLKEWMNQYTSKENFDSLSSKTSSDMLLCSMWMFRQEEINKLQSQLEAEKKKVAVLMECVSLWKEAYPNDTHECFSTGPVSGNFIADHIDCPHCFADELTRETLAKIKEMG